MRLSGAFPVESGILPSHKEAHTPHPHDHRGNTTRHVHPRSVPRGTWVVVTLERAGRMHKAEECSTWNISRPRCLPIKQCRLSYPRGSWEPSGNAMPWIQPQGRDEVRSGRVLPVEPFRDFIEWGSRNPVAMQQFDTMFHVEHSERGHRGPGTLVGNLC